MKTLYLHIGTPKTGTSSLQQFCIRNRSALNAQSCEYPTMPFRYTDIGLERNGCFLTVGSRGETDEEIAENTRRLFTALALLRETFQTYNTVILSDEGLWSALADQLETFWEPLLSHARENNYEVKVLVYLRRQDKLAESRYNQMIKAAERIIGTISLDEWMNGLGAGRMDYYSTLERIAAQIGRENMIVRIYDRAQLEKDGGSIFTDFLMCTGLNPDNSFLIPKRDENADALSPNMLAIKRAVNRLPGHTRDNGIDKNFRLAATTCSAEFNDVPRMSLFSPDERASLLENLKEGNERIAREYLHREGPLFAPADEESETWTPDNPWMAEDTVRYFRQLAICQNDETTRNNTDAMENAALEQDFSYWLKNCSEYEHADAPYERTVNILGGFFLMRQLMIAEKKVVKPFEPERAAHYARVLLLNADRDRAATAVQLIDDQYRRAADLKNQAGHTINTFSQELKQVQKEDQTLKSQLEQARKEKQALQSELEQTRKEKQTLKSELEQTQKEKQALKSELEQTRKKKQILQRKLDGITNSRSYKLSMTLAKPVRKLKRKFKA